jgi:predicted DNA-binding antitoxin AbrB/MazE fold protein
MPTKVKAVYEGGVFRPLEPVDFTEKTPVELIIIEALPQRSVVDETHGLIHIDPETARMIAEDPLFALWDEAACH